MKLSVNSLTINSIAKLLKNNPKEGSNRGLQVSPDILPNIYGWYNKNT